MHTAYGLYASPYLIIPEHYHFVKENGKKARKKKVSGALRSCLSVPFVALRAGVHMGWEKHVNKARGACCRAKNVVFFENQRFFEKKP